MAGRVRLDELTIDHEIQLQTRGIDRETVGAYVEAIANDAPMPPVVVYRENGHNWLADGFHRVEATRFLGLVDIEAEVRDGTRQDALVFAATANVTNGKPMSRAQKREGGERLIRLTTWNDSDIARQLAVAHSTVSNWRDYLSKIGKIDNRPRTVTRNGTTYQMDTSSIGKQPTINATKEELDRLDQTPFGQWAQDNQALGLNDFAEPIQEPIPPSVHYSSETPEHFTPQVIIDATLACLGDIDLDPCSNLGEPSIPAKAHFTLIDDGLSQEWHGHVYMNPPYGREIGKWIEKLCQEHAAGRTTEAIALVPSRTDTQWWLQLRDFPVCFIQGRLTFLGNEDPAPFPSAVFYLGEDLGAFYHAFYELGDCWQRMMPGISFGE